MSSGRRVNDRRRRVLYSAQHADQNATTASRSEARRWREARRPQEAYGSRVHRRLRGRWFSLVPVRRRSLIAVVGSLLATVILLSVAHYGAVSWPSIAYRPDLARPLRLDRPDSFGHCLMVALLAASTGASLLIYQLRRYRNDDFKGHYRLWRLVMIVMFLASINAMVGMIDWGGALLDMLFGKRVALTGGDWIRLVVSLGSAILAIRLIAEVRRCRSSLAWMITAWMLLAVPESAKWNVMSVDSLSRWILVTSAPLFACTALFLSLGTYLRMLYREVRQIEDGDPVVERFRQFAARWFQRVEPVDDDQQTNARTKSEADADTDSEPQKRRWWQRKQRPTPKQLKPKHSNSADIDEAPARKQSDTDDNDSEESETVDASEQRQDNRRTSPAKPKAKRRWFGLRRAKPERDDSQRATGDEKRNSPQESDAGTPPAKKRSRFSLRLKPPSANAASSSAQDTSEEQESSSESKAASKLGWFRRGKSNSAEAEAKSSSSRSTTAKPSTQVTSDTPDDDAIDADDIDWNSLNKAERRRLRKQLKRQNRAA